MILQPHAKIRVAPWRFQPIEIGVPGPMKTTMPVASEAGRYTVRDAVPADAEAIAWILNPIIEAGVYTVIDGPVTADQERGFIVNCSPRGIFHVAVDPADGALVGF